MKKMTINEIQKRELELLKAFDSVARKYKIKYSLCAGTLLGAVRHKGFIPWDDDIDISVPRPDYERLIRLNRKKDLWPPHIKLSCFEDGTLDAPFMKIFDINTKIKEDNFKQNDVKHLWIDVFPVDGLPADKRRLRLLYHIALNLCRLNVASVVNNGYGSSKAVILIKDLFMKPFSNLVGRKNISKLQKKLAYLHPYKSSKFCGMVTWAYDGPGQALTKKEYETLVELPFEGYRFFAMSAWDKNLRGIFGDYMKLPPENERITHNLEAYSL